MRAFLIDPAAQTVERLDNDQNWPHEAVAEAIGVKGPLASAPVQMGRRDSDRVWLDDEGHLVADRPVFFIGEYAMPLAGKGLVLGVDHRGENRGPEVSLDELKELVQFSNMVTAGRLTAGFQTPLGYHTGLPICEPAPGWTPKEPARASFTVELRGQVLCLEDVGDHRICPSLTNDAEAVFRVLRDMMGPRMANTPVLYKDTEGRWDAMIPNNAGLFRSFVVLGAKSYEEARERLDAMFGAR